MFVCLLPQTPSFHSQINGIECTRISPKEVEQEKHVKGLNSTKKCKFVFILPSNSISFLSDLTGGGMVHKFSQREVEREKRKRRIVPKNVNSSASALELHLVSLSDLTVIGIVLTSFSQREVEREKTRKELE
ncbi:hypothetical protein AVEN_135109-1 [Araneus ventricosus]|uniref:Uncharacterized protein n=1 Tax=Araneus ventricosus TaxID=182803 RepID=A0A4Y2JNM6_ARAVE|nr:hypothetical protein AVEN_135109-1 [Araneus ventricosus]